MKRRLYGKSPMRNGFQTKAVLGVIAFLVLAGVWGQSSRQEAIVDSMAAAESSLTGIASVIDGDTIEIHGQRIRLHGIDAPESHQLCEAEGKQYRCGQRAALALSDLLGSHTVSCEKLSTDQYRRVIAKCAVAGRDVGAWIVEHGWAVAYRRYSIEYAGLEREAKAARRGIWAGEFQEPEQWRREQRGR